MKAETRIGTYDEFVEAMLADNWQYMDSRSPHVLTRRDTEFISTCSIKAGGYGKFIEIKCPLKPLMNLAINGMNQLPFLQHHISLRCRDDTSFELPGRTQISIMKFDSKDKPVFNTWLTYNEIAMTTGSRFRYEGERYRLKERGILLCSGETLAFYVYESDIDIVRTEIRLECDIFVKEQGERV